MRAIVFVYADEAPSRSFCIRCSPRSSTAAAQNEMENGAKSHFVFFICFSHCHSVFVLALF
jgi:hypothetical protein